MTNSDFEKRISALRSAHEELIGRKNPAADSNGVWTRYTYPILTAAHTPLFWRYDLNPATNPFLLERFGINGTFNAGAIKFDGKYVLVVRVEGNDRKSFFALAESDNGIDGYRFRDLRPMRTGGFTASSVPNGTIRRQPRAICRQPWRRPVWPGRRISCIGSASPTSSRPRSSATSCSTLNS